MGSLIKKVDLLATVLEPGKPKKLKASHLGVPVDVPSMEASDKDRRAIGN